MSELVSIVIPVKNEANRISALVEGLWKQNYRPLEVIFVDGSSTDGTPELIERCSKRFLTEGFTVRLFREDDFGPLRSPANARNIGVTNAKGKYIALFDADFEFFGDLEAVSEVVKELKRSEHVAITYMPNMHTFVEENLALDDMIYYFNGGKPLHIICAFRKEVFSRALFDSALGFREDFDFLERIGTKYAIVETRIRRCYPHTLKEFAKQQLWYGRTALTYFRKRMPRKWIVNLIKSNAVLGLLLLSIIVLSFAPVLSLAPSSFMLTLIVYRWLRKDIKVLGMKNMKTLLKRFLWLVVREVYGRLFFDIGLLKALTKEVFHLRVGA